MRKIKRLVSLFLIAVLLSIGAAGTIYAANNSEDNANNLEIDSSTEPKNGDLTKNSKYPFYDEVGVLSKDTKNIILNINKNFEKEGAQIGVVVLKSLDGDSVEEKANKIFNTWGLGSKERNDGALLLISMADRKFRLEVGDGLRYTVLSDSDAKYIIDQMVPYFRKEAYDLGINVALFEIDQRFYNYRDFLKENSNKREGNLPMGSSKNKSADSSNFYGDQPSSRKDHFNLIACYIFIAGFALVLFITPLVAIYDFVSGTIRRRREEKEEQGRIDLYGPKHEFKVEVVDQFGGKETFEYSDYSRKKVDKDRILNKIESWVMNYGFFGRSVTGYSIESMSHNIDNAKCHDIDTLRINIKTTGREEAFTKDEDRVKLTQGFYSRLSPDEQSFYTSKASSMMENRGGTNIWFYMYLYMLHNSEKRNQFNLAMGAAGMKSDGFYHPPRIGRYRGYSSSSSSSSSSSRFGSNFGGGFGGFGGGISSGGGASGGW